jgi:hypothetical protein
MHGRTATLIFSAALLGFVGGIAIRARGAGQAPAADQPLSHEERARLLATRKELFNLVSGEPPLVQGLAGL